MASSEGRPTPKPTDVLPKTLLSDVAPVFSPILSEVGTERKLFAIVGSTVVSDPDFIHLVSRAEGDGLGTKTSEMEETLGKIAQRKATLADLRVLAEKYASEHNDPKGPYNDLKLAAVVVRFMKRVINLDSKAREIPFPGIWSRIVILNGQPYAICSLDKPQNDFLQTLRQEKKGQTDIPRYNAGVLDGYNADCYYESEAHTKIGPLAYRLAAIVNSTRIEAFEDLMRNPQEIEVGIQPDANFPDGRLYTIAKRRILR